MNHVFLRPPHFLLMICLVFLPQIPSYTSFIVTGSVSSIRSTVIFVSVCGNAPFTKFTHTPIQNVFNECSRNKTKFEPYVYPIAVNIYSDCYGCNFLNWADAVDKTIYPYVSQNTIYVLPKTIECNWAGMGYVGCLNKAACRIWIHGLYIDYEDTLFHELGHNMGLTHAHARTKTNQTIPYGDNTCAMGLCCWSRCYNAPHQEQLGWSSPIHIVKISKNTLHTSRLYVIPHTRSTARSFLRIETQTQWLYIEYRKYMEKGTDASLSRSYPNLTNAVHIYSSQPGNALGTQTILEHSLYTIRDSWSIDVVKVTLMQKSSRSASIKIDIS